MTFFKPQIAPGVVKDESELTAEGVWTDADKVRFRTVAKQGLPQIIGGWEKAGNDTVSGKARAIHVWEDLDNNRLVAIGTHKKLYVWTSSYLWDVTPVRASATLTDKIDTTDTDATVTIDHTSHGVDDGARVYLHNGTAVGGLTLGGSGSLSASPFTTISGSKFVIVSQTAHGISTGEFVTFASATTTNGIDAAKFNTTHRVYVLNANNYMIHVDTAATASGTGGGTPTFTWLQGFDATYVDADTFTVEASSAATSTASSGGGTITYKYEINPGRERAALTAGYSTGTYSSGYYSLASSETDLRARVWHFSNYGEELIANYGKSVLYRWQNVLSQQAAAIAATDAPAQSLSHMVTPERFLVALGTEDAATSTFDAMRVAWASQEAGYTTNDWTAASTNTAGDFRLAEGGRIVRGLPMPGASLVWTDTALYGLQYLQDTTYIFRPQLLGTGCGLIGPNAVARTGDNGAVFWLSSSRRFMVWQGGAPTVVPCSVREYLFDNLAPVQEDLIFAGTNDRFNEVWWFYPTRADNECAAYVAYNYREGHWTIGTFNITCWADRGVLQYPVAVWHDDSYLRLHEKGTSADGGAFSGHVESGYIDAGDGDRLMRVQKFIPDMKDLVGGVDVTLTAKIWPQGDETSTSFGTLGTATTQLDARITGRQIKLKLASNSAPTSWRCGSIGFDVIETAAKR
jgi:hypothetical protein